MPYAKWDRERLEVLREETGDEVVWQRFMARMRDGSRRGSDPTFSAITARWVLAMIAESGRVVRRPRPLALACRLRVAGRWHVLF